MPTTLGNTVLIIIIKSKIMQSHHKPRTLLLYALQAAVLLPYVSSTQADALADCARFAGIEAWQGWISLQGKADKPAYFGFGELTERENLNIKVLQFDTPLASPPCPGNIQIEANAQAGKVLAEGRFSANTALFSKGSKINTYDFSGGNPLGYLDNPHLALSFVSGSYSLPFKIAAGGSLYHFVYPDISQTQAASYFFGPYDPLSGA
jgi:hypothetical protein